MFGQWHFRELRTSTACGVPLVRRQNSPENTVPLLLSEVENKERQAEADFNMMSIPLVLPVGLPYHRSVRHQQSSDNLAPS